MVRMTLPARRPPFVQLERVAINRYRLHKWLTAGPGAVARDAADRVEG